MKRHVCIHGHFYQPPRENPWLEDVELQESAYPYHDWNERISAECYEPNTVSRILTDDNWIQKIVNNYSRINFNFGPTLLSWMEKKEPELYRAIIRADRKSMDNFSGHGSAIAQAYNHMIMPLANRRDKLTQVLWGIRDFEQRFGRKPEGMWLPETAVDLETLDIMAEHNIRFTVLSPYQAHRVRPLAGGDWRETGPGVDPTMPYRINLPETGRSINVFFYNGDISRAVAFEKLLTNGERFARRLLGGFQRNGSPQLSNIATDGETYGHHHRHGEMALAYAIHFIENNKLARITNYAEYLEHYPPTHEAEIHNYSAWSCAHGVGRWERNCGCNSGMRPGWSQEWREPLRKALNWLRDEIALQYEELVRQFLKDPWEARNGYIDVILNRSPKNLQRFLKKHAGKNLRPEEITTVLKLLEMQRHAMLMFTSCGWFFDELSGIETVQVLKYAGRVIQLATELFKSSPEERFLEMMALAGSNIPEHRDGAHIYEKFVKPAMVDLLKVGAHYAICSLFETYGDNSSIYCYKVRREDFRNHLAGGAKLAVGRVLVTSEITRESSHLTYGVVNFGKHNLNAGVRYYQGPDLYQETVRDVTVAFERADFAEVIRQMDRHFDGATYSLRELFRDKQQMVLDQILESTLTKIAEFYNQIYENTAPLMRFLKDIDIPQPGVLQSSASFVLNTNLRLAFSAEPPLDIEHILALMDEARVANVSLDGTVLGYVLEQTLERMSQRLSKKPLDSSLISHLDAVIGLVRTLPFEVDLWKLQNVYYRLLHTTCRDLREKARQGDSSAGEWAEQFNSLGDKLRMRRG